MRTAIRPAKMSPLLRVILVAAAAVLVYDAVAAVASRSTGFPYTSAVYGSYIVYAGAGYFGMRVSGRLWAGALAGGTTGLADSTLGWLISNAIGPYIPPMELPTGPAAVLAVVIVVSLSAALIGLIGAFASKLLKATPSSPPA